MKRKQFSLFTPLTASISFICITSIVVLILWTINLNVTDHLVLPNCFLNGSESERIMICPQWDAIYHRSVFKLNSSRKIIYVITPTYTRITQMADLTKMAQTLMLVKDSVLWIVLEDESRISAKISQLLRRSNINHIHTAVPQPNRQSADMYQKGGLTQRNFGLYLLRKHFRTHLPSSVLGWVYFADDDNIYDVRLFDKMKRIKRLGVWPVGFSGGVIVEGFNYAKSNVLGDVPHVTDWLVGWWPERSFAVDMGAFAISLSEILSKRNVVMRPIKLPEFTFLNDMQFNVTDCEAVTYDTDDVLMWHTKLVNPDLKNEAWFKVVHGFNSNEKYNV